MPRKKTKTSTILAAAAIGAGCMYLLDPVNGKRRRTRIGDKFGRLSHAVEDGAGTVARDLTNRTLGVAATVARVFQKISSEDPVLEPRVRSEMGRWVSHPHSIHVEARNGRIILSGSILAAEERNLLRHLAQVPGVKEVENHLRAHEEGENFPGLHGGIRREPRFELFQSHWAPGPRLLATIAGAAMMGSGIRSRSLIGWGASVAGVLLMVRAVTNMEFQRLAGSGIAQVKTEAEKGKPSDSGISIPISRKQPGEYQVH